MSSVKWPNIVYIVCLMLVCTIGLCTVSDLLPVDTIIEYRKVLNVFVCWLKWLRATVPVISGLLHPLECWVYFWMNPIDNVNKMWPVLVNEFIWLWRNSVNLIIWIWRDTINIV